MLVVAKALSAVATHSAVFPGGRGEPRRRAAPRPASGGRQLRGVANAGAQHAIAGAAPGETACTRRQLRVGDYRTRLPSTSAGGQELWRLVRICGMPGAPGAGLRSGPVHSGGQWTSGPVANGRAIRQNPGPQPTTTCALETHQRRATRGVATEEDSGRIVAGAGAATRGDRFQPWPAIDFTAPDHHTHHRGERQRRRGAPQVRTTTPLGPLHQRGIHQHPRHRRTLLLLGQPAGPLNHPHP
ncbi:Uncharacterised protein [Mycobacteroides abscessus subsp. bolletii]|nr:Uncharacterised protein [Mycobacteroides abscessus subsp. bolletii]